MIPKTDEAALPDLTFGTQPGRTYALNTETGRIIGMIDGLEAVKQAVHLILSAERYRYLIYSWNYGVELAGLIGQPTALVLPEIQRYITEALMQDDRIVGVENFDFEVKGKKVLCSFTVHTAYGEFESETEVSV